MTTQYQPMPDKQAGVTLVEVLITMGLLAAFLVILSGILASTADIQSRTGSYAAITTDGRYLLTRLDYDIKRASNITTPANAGDTATSLTLVIDGDTHTYTVIDGKLTLDIDGTSAAVTDSKTTVTNLQFQKLGNSTETTAIRYTFTLSSDTNHDTQTQTFTSSTSVRRP